MHGATMKKIWHVTVSVENLFFGGLARQDFRLKLRAGCT